MRRLHFAGLTGLLLSAGLAMGCTGGYRGTAVVSSGGYGYYEPDLVYVGPGVYAVADYEVPVFYSNNFYWRYDDAGRWYRSRYFDRGYAYARPPRAVISIESPHRYRHYRGGYVAQRGRTYDRTQGDRYDRPARYYRDRDGQIRVRDHRRR